MDFGASLLASLGREGFFAIVALLALAYALIVWLFLNERAERRAIYALYDQTVKTFIKQQYEDGESCTRAHFMVELAIREEGHATREAIRAKRERDESSAITGRGGPLSQGPAG